MMNAMVISADLVNNNITISAQVSTDLYCLRHRGLTRLRFLRNGDQVYTVLERKGPIRECERET